MPYDLLPRLILGLPWQLAGDRRVVGSNPDPPGNL